jgi:hypothetical protein
MHLNLHMIWLHNRLNTFHSHSVICLQEHDVVLKRRRKKVMALISCKLGYKDKIEKDISGEDVEIRKPTHNQNISSVSFGQ